MAKGSSSIESNLSWGAEPSPPWITWNELGVVGLATITYPTGFSYIGQYTLTAVPEQLGYFAFLNTHGYVDYWALAAAMKIDRTLFITDAMLT